MNVAATDECTPEEPEDPCLGLVARLGPDGRAIAGASIRAEDALLLRMYREMKRVRLLDERMMMLQRQGRVGFYGACTGQEASVVGTGLAARAEDWIFPALRENAITLLRGFPLVSYVAQIYGNARDPMHGRQMPAHVSSRSVRQVSWSSCIGNQIPQAVGAALAAKLKRDPVVIIGFLGDGATSEADFHAAMNFAGVFQVPAVLVCQNNQWAISVPVAKQSASATLAIKAKAYGVPGARVDGNDVVAVHEVVAAAVERARRGEGPTFVELVTYRVAPHSTSDDPSRYRSSDEVEAWIRKDPLDRLGRFLKARALLSTEEDERFERELSEEIRKAIEEVEAFGPPDEATLFEDVYAELPWHLVEERALLEKAPRKHHRKTSDSDS